MLLARECQGYYDGQCGLYAEVDRKCRLLEGRELRPWEDLKCYHAADEGLEDAATEEGAVCEDVVDLRIGEGGDGGHVEVRC